MEATTTYIREDDYNLSSNVESEVSTVTMADVVSAVTPIPLRRRSPYKISGKHLFTLATDQSKVSGFDSTVRVYAISPEEKYAEVLGRDRKFHLATIHKQKEKAVFVFHEIDEEPMVRSISVEQLQAILPQPYKNTDSGAWAFVHEATGYEWKYGYDFYGEKYDKRLCAMGDEPKRASLRRVLSPQH